MGQSQWYTGATYSGQEPNPPLLLLLCPGSLKCALASLLTCEALTWFVPATLPLRVTFFCKDPESP